MAASVYKICSCRPQQKLKCRHSWWFSFKRRGIKDRIRKSLNAVLEKQIDSKTVAEQEANRLRTGIVDDSLSKRTRELLGLPASLRPSLEVLTVGHLLDRYRERHIVHTADEERQGYKIGAITRTEVMKADGRVSPFGQWLVSDVNADALERLRETRRVRGVHKRATGSNIVGGQVAANRDLRLLRAAFNWAIKVGCVEHSPFKRGTVSAVTLAKDTARSRRLQQGEAELLLAACGTHLRDLVEAALETGCRRGELLSLQWNQIQLTRRPELWLPGNKTKIGKARRIPISSRLEAILRTRRLGPDDEPFPATAYVFGNELGQRVLGVKTAWRLACARARIQDLRFHDLRREAGSRWMEAGVPLATIQRWLGHTNIAQTSTYLATTTFGEHEAMRRFEERVGRLTPIDTEGGTPPPKRAPRNTSTNKKAQQISTEHQ
ncbi:MAG: site-specific integrase [Acidobacteriota bacterium]